MTAVQGKIQNVQIVGSGSFLEADSGIGATTLYLTDISDFTDEGGTISIGGATPVDYLTVTEVEDFNTDAEGQQNPPTLTMTLALATAVNYVADTPVSNFPYSEEMIAQVLVTGNNDDAVDCVVPPELAQQLDTGVRTQGYDDESVMVDVGPTGAMVVVSLVGEQGQILARNVTVGPGEYVSDGKPPPGSPTPDLVGGIGTLYATWDAVVNNDLVTYDLYLSTDPAYTTPTPAEFIGSTTGTSAVIKSDAGGNIIIAGTPYVLLIIARDDDGSAAAGGPGTASPRLISGPDISVNYVYAGAIFAEKIQSGTLGSDIVLGAKIQTAKTGARVEMSAQGILVYSPLGTPTTVLGSDGTSTFNGDVVANTITVLGGMNIQGTDNIIGKGAVVTIADKVPNPTTPPTYVIDWLKTKLTGKTFDPNFYVTSFQYDGSNWLVGSASNDVYASPNPSAPSDQVIYFDYFNAAGAWVSQAAALYLPRTSLSVIDTIKCGSTYVALCIDPALDELRLVNLTLGTLIKVLTRGFTSGGTTPVLSTDGTYVYLTDYENPGVSGRFRIWKYDLAATVGSNLITNGTFNANTTGWSITGGTLSWSPGNPGGFGGFPDGCAVMTKTGGAGTMTLRSTTGFAVSPGKRYYYEGAGIDPTSGSLKPTIGIEWYNASNVLLGTSQLQGPSTPITATPQSFGGVATAPLDAATGKYIFKWTSAPNGQTCIVDNAIANATAGMQNIGGSPDAWYPCALGPGIYPTAVLHGGNFDFGHASTLIVAGQTTFSYNPSTGAAIPNDNFPTASTFLAWDSTNSLFYSLLPVTRNEVNLFKHEPGNSWTTQDAKWWAGYTAYDSDPTGGTHETTLSGVVGFNMQKRARLTLTAPGVADLGGSDDPDGVVFYLGRLNGSTKPANSAMWDNGYAALVSGQETKTITSALFTGTVVTDNPPVATNFPSNSPGSIASQATDGGGAIAKIAGDGSGRMGPYSWTAAGADASTWTTLITGPTTVSGWTITKLQYRRVGSLVGWKGNFINATGSTITAGTNGNITGDPTIAAAGTVPAALRPSSGAAGDVFYVQATNAGVATLWIRINLDGSMSLTHALPNFALTNGLGFDINDLVMLG